MKVKSEREVAQSGPTLSDPMDCSLPGSSIHGIFQARVLEWGAIRAPLATFSCAWVCSELWEKGEQQGLPWLWPFHPFPLQACFPICL